MCAWWWQFLQHCTSVWVAAEIHRAESDKAAKTLMGEHFRRQLLMDGRYSMMTFVCTKVDSSLQTTEICRYSKCVLMRCTST